MKLRHVTLLLPFALTGAAHAGLGLVVPAYFDPNVRPGDWTALAASASLVPLITIMNPNSGPANSVDPAYTAAISAIRTAGGKVIGYVDTGYGAVASSTVLSQIGTYASQYPLDGVFLDEVDNSGGSSSLSYYQGLADTIRSAHPGWSIMANPGANIPASYLPSADQFMDFENYANAYPAFMPDPWAASAPQRVVNVLHTEASSAGMEADLALAVSDHAGWAYVTDRVMPNPYDQLPSYWLDEVRAAQSVPEPAGLAYMAVGFGVVGMVLRRR